MAGSFVSVRRHAKDIPGRWARPSCLVAHIRESGMQSDDRGKNYSGKVLFGCNNPPEPVIFPVLPLIRKMQEQEASGVDP